ncbi:MAG: hypothetical protein GY737_14365 [Desulfobacteraceae bacterium]|nr:hypothetical protein [Desulfobacteraceae bacterium]
MKKISLLLLSVLILTGCVGHKKYVGRTADYNNGFWCMCDGKPCKVADEYFVFEYTILENNGEYTVEGTIDPTKGRLKSWSVFQKQGTHFNLLLIGSDHVIFDSCPINYIPNLSRKMNFSKTLTPEKEIKAIAITWECSVRG